MIILVIDGARYTGDNVNKTDNSLIMCAEEYMLPWNELGAIFD